MVIEAKICCVSDGHVGRTKLHMKTIDAKFEVFMGFLTLTYNN